MSSAPCGGEGLPPSAPDLPASRVAALTGTAPVRLATTGGAFAAPPRPLLPASRATRLDDPPELSGVASPATSPTS